MVRGLSQIFAAGPAVVDGLGEHYKGASDHEEAKETLAVAISIHVMGLLTMKWHQKPKRLHEPDTFCRLCLNMLANLLAEFAMIQNIEKKKSY